MPLTPRQLNRATLARQLLLRRESLDAGEGVSRVVALQAQEPPSPYLALWSRLTGFRPADLDAAIADRVLVKATLMRITLHLVHADDYPTMHLAMQPTLRAARLGDTRFTSTGITAVEADKLVPEVLDYLQQPRSNAELEAWLGERLGEPAKRVWWALRSFAPVRHASTGGPWAFGRRPAYVASDSPGLDREASPDDHLPGLVRRYLDGFGPASVADIAQFAMVQRARIRRSLETLDDGLKRLVGPDGIELYDVPDAPRPAEETAAPPRLLPMWDSVLLAYADRSRVVPPEYRRTVTRNNGDVLPTLLVDGYVAGVWRPVDGGIEATAFHELTGEAWDGLADEARSLVELLGEREPGVYRRYERWWAALPADQVRVLPG